MTPTTRRLFVTAVVSLALAAVGRAAETPETAITLPVLPAPRPTAESPAYVLPAPGWPTLGYARPDPLLDRTDAAQPGPYANVEANVLELHLRNQLAGPVPNPVTGTADTVSFPGNRLDAAVSPRLEFGYRLADNWGGLQLSYRFLATRGGDRLTTGIAGGPASQDGRLDYNIIDFDYVSREFSLRPDFTMRWGAGPRMMFLYFDSRLRAGGPGLDAGSVIGQGESNHLRCYGFGAFLDLEYHTAVAGLSVFGRLEGADTYARIHQVYTETVAGGPGAAARTASADFTGAAGVPMLREVLGLSYTVPSWNYTRFMVGYQYETFFQIGRLSPSSGVIDTRGQLDAHGLFLRAEMNF